MNKNFKVVYAPKPIPQQDNRPKIFIGGAIDNGNAPNWQKEIEDLLSGYSVILLNPRRPKWNPNASSSVIRNQIRWELDAQHYSDFNIYVFPEKTIAPISLLEFGLFINKRMLVYCAKDYWKYINISETCKYYGINLFTNWNVFKEQLLLETEFLLRQRSFIKL